MGSRTARPSCGQVERRCTSARICSSPPAAMPWACRRAKGASARCPTGIRAHAFGPRLAAVLGYLRGSHHVSHRGLEEVAEVVFGVPLSLGSVTALQEQISAALLPA